MSNNKIDEMEVSGDETDSSLSSINENNTAYILAEEKKNSGNVEYGKKKYDAALRLYSEAIDLNPSCASYYGNKAAAYMMLGQYTKAVDDARRSTQLDPSFMKGFQREAKSQLALGEVGAAVHLYDKVITIEPNNQSAIAESKQAKRVQDYVHKSDECFKKAEYRTVVYNMDRCLDICPDCHKFRILKAECLALLQRYQEAQDIASDILRLDGSSADAIYVRGLCLYYMDNCEKAFQHFQQVLRLAPDHTKARTIYRKAKTILQKKEEGNESFKQGKLQEAYDLYSEALLIDPNNISTNSKLYFNRATVSCKMTKNDQAIDDCSKAIKLDDKYLKAYLRRAKCYMDLEQIEDAIRDYEKICKLDKSKENKTLLQNAKLELKKSKRKDYYKILALNKDANEDEIKKAYRKHALLHHPDRHANATDEAKKLEEKKFKEIGEAYSVLSDPKKKARYDNGQDLEDMASCGAGGFGGDMDPNVIFQTFFGGNGGFSGFQTHTSGGGSSGGFPGHFTYQFG